MSQSFLKLQGTARWDLAITDANLKFPEAAGTFTCSLGAPITETETPYLYQLLRRTIVDAGLSTYRAKNEYERLRPFMQNNEPTCTPEEEAHLRESRMVCNVHWNSDVREGRIVAAAVVAKLHSNPEFRYDLAAAKEEIAAVRAKNLPPTRDCPAETAALAVQPEPQ